MVEDSCSDDPNFLPKIFFAKSPREYFNHSATSQSFDQTTNQHTKLHPNWILIQFHSHIKNVSRRVLPALELLQHFQPSEKYQVEPSIFSQRGPLYTAKQPGAQFEAKFGLSLLRILFSHLGLPRFGRFWGLFSPNEPSIWVFVVVFVLCFTGS